MFISIFWTEKLYACVVRSRDCKGLQGVERGAALTGGVASSLEPFLLSALQLTAPTHCLDFHERNERGTEKERGKEIHMNDSERHIAIHDDKRIKIQEFYSLYKRSVNKCTIL
jgi:hypothetical protein